MKKSICFVLALVFMTSFVLAEISLSKPESVYNLGDRFYLNANGLRGADSGSLNVDLVCGNQTVNLERMRASRFGTDKDYSYNLPGVILDKIGLGISNLTKILNKCQVILSIGGQTASTKPFIITNKILVSASTDRASYNPGEGILVRINATKANGDLLNGFVNVTNATDFSKVIKEGFVTKTFSMPKTIEAGVYSLVIHAYDTGRGGVLNEGSGVTSFRINQVASSIILSLSDVKATPGKNFSIGAEVFDQSGTKMEGIVSVKIISPENKIITNTVQAGKFISIDFPLNASVGNWKVIATFDGVSEEKDVEMMKASRMEYSIKENVLEVRCVGNWKCNGTINVLIGNESLELQLAMNLNEVRKFSLKAPRGKYNVSVSDGEHPINKQVLLTGSAISIGDFKKKMTFKMDSGVWIFLIIILGATGILFFTKYRKTKTIGKKDIIGGLIGKTAEKVDTKISEGNSQISPSLNFTTKSPTIKKSNRAPQNNENKDMIDLTKNKVENAESALVLKGEKHTSAIIALNIKNYAELGDNAKETLVKIIRETKEIKGLVDWKEEHIFIVFSPLITRTYKNEILALKEGFRILESLKDYNKKFKDKIEFNIGVHTGELLESKTEGKLKYTSIGNTISLAKRIADSDDGKLLVSDDIRKKMLRDLKTTKANEIGKNQIYEVSEIRDREANDAKLKDLLRRMS